MFGSIQKSNAFTSGEYGLRQERILPNILLFCEIPINIASSKHRTCAYQIGNLNLATTYDPYCTYFSVYADNISIERISAEQMSFWKYKKKVTNSEIPLH